MVLEVGVGRCGIVVYTQLQEVRGQVARVEPSSEVPGGMEQAANWYCKCCVVCCRMVTLTVHVCVYSLAVLSSVSSSSGYYSRSWGRRMVGGGDYT